MSLSNNFPTVSPTLNLNFAAAGRLDSRVTFTRSSTATYTNQIGLIQSAAVNEPRFDYNPSTLAARGLLIEEQRTNLVLYSEQFDNAAWFAFSADGSTTANATTSPDGTNNADLFVPNTSSAVHRVSQTFSSSSSLYSISVYAKAGGYSRLSIFMGGANQGAVFDLSAVTVVADTRFAAAPSNMSIVSVGNGWYRCSFSSNISNSADNIQLSPLDSSASPGGSWSGNGTSGMYFWGAQLEAGSFATSYIPTVASSVTRSADVASVNTLSPWFSSTEGTLFAEASLSTAGRYAGLYKTGSDNQIEIVQLNSGQINFFAYDAGAIQVNSNIAGTAFSTNKTAFAYKANDYASCVNGSAVTTDTSASVPSLNYANINAYQISGPLGSGHIRRITYYSARLTNAQLQALTL